MPLPESESATHLTAGWSFRFVARQQNPDARPLPSRCSSGPLSACCHRNVSPALRTTSSAVWVVESSRARQAFKQLDKTGQEGLEKLTRWLIREFTIRV